MKQEHLPVQTLWCLLDNPSIWHSSEHVVSILMKSFAGCFVDLVFGRESPAERKLPP